jgi:penicillin-binding protein 2
MLGSSRRKLDRGEYNLTTRYIVFFFIVLLMFLYLTLGLINLQLNSGEEYSQNAENRRTTKITLRGSRGMITDADAVILAKDEMVYNVTFYRDASQNSTDDYKAFTLAISDAIDIIEENGNELSVSFVIERTPDGLGWQFNFGSRVSEAVLQTRESQWRDNNYFTTASVPTPAVAMEKLIKRYNIPKGMSEKKMLQVMAVYSEMQMNLYNSQPIVIAEDVPYETVIEIETRSMSLPGLEIAVGTKRVYPRSTLAAQVIGYIGAIPSVSKWEELSQKGYQYSDSIGLDGIEASMEDWLTQDNDDRQGYKIVERDSVGKITRELSYVEPQDGNNVKLTIYASYQQQAERSLAENVAKTRESQEAKLMDNTWLESNKADIESRNWTKYPLSLADRAAMMVIDMEGRVLAMANYPTYDLNALVAAGPESAEILTDDRNVLMNYNIQARGTPGSIFKMVSALGALMEGELLPNETISDAGYFTEYTQDQTTAPRCWISEANRYKHQYQTIVEGLAHSCNYFFYTLGSRLGETRLYQYASEFGLTSKTGIDLPGEQRSIVGCQTSLYDPDKAMDEASQDTSVPIIVFNSIKKHLKNQGAIRNITYDDEHLNRCIKRLMDMAVNTNQTDWVVSMRPILMEELNMTREMVYLQSMIGDIYIYLNDIKWGGAQTIQVAIGQSVTTVTPAAISRYAAALANGGAVYNLMIVDSVTSPEGDILSQRTPTVMNQFEDENLDEYLALILKGMKGVVDESGTAEKYFRDWDYSNNICAKTGTAEVTSIDLENNAWFIMLAPYEDPEIAVVVFIPSGYSGGEASLAAREFVGWYMDQKTLRTDSGTFPGGNMLAP